MPNPNDIISCPYDRAHTVVLSRIQFHLARCRTQHPKAETTTCPFNAAHVVNKVELEWHLEFCKSRITGEREFFQVGAEKKIEEPAVVVDDTIPTTAGEVWGEEDACGEDVLNRVKEVSMSKPTLSNKICAPKAVRKQHKLDERRRFIEVNNINIHNDPALSPSPMTGGPKPQDAEDNSAQQKTEPRSQKTEKPEPQAIETKPLKTEKPEPQAIETKPLESPKQSNPWPLPSEQGQHYSNTRPRQLPPDNKKNQPPISKPSQERWSGWKDVGAVSSGLSNINISETRDRTNPWAAPKPAANNVASSEDFPSLPAGRGRRVL